MEDGSLQNLVIDLDDESQKKEVELKLTLGQLMLVYQFLSQNIQPKGYQMIEFAHDLLKRLDTALTSIDKEGDF
jgi:hypothetical protein